MKKGVKIWIGFAVIGLIGALVIMQAKPTTLSFFGDEYSANSYWNGSYWVEMNRRELPPNQGFSGQATGANDDCATQSPQFFSCPGIGEWGCYYSQWFDEGTYYGEVYSEKWSEGSGNDQKRKWQVSYSPTRVDIPLILNGGYHKWYLAKYCRCVGTHYQYDTGTGDCSKGTTWDSTPDKSTLSWSGFNFNNEFYKEDDKCASPSGYKIVSQTFGSGAIVSQNSFEFPVQSFCHTVPVLEIGVNLTPKQEYEPYDTINKGQSVTIPVDQNWTFYYVADEKDVWKPAQPSVTESVWISLQQFWASFESWLNALFGGGY